MNLNMLKKAINCINPNILGLYKKSADLEHVSHKILKHLPEKMLGEVKIASFDKGLLVLSYNKQAIASELRYLIPELRNNLRVKEKLYNIVNIKIIQS